MLSIRVLPAYFISPSLFSFIAFGDKGKVYIVRKSILYYTALKGGLKNGTG